MSPLGQMLVEDGYKEGMQTGRQDGMLEVLYGLVKDGLLTVKQASERCGKSVEAFQKGYQENQKQQ